MCCVLHGDRRFVCWLFSCMYYELSYLAYSYPAPLPSLPPPFFFKEGGGARRGREAAGVEKMRGAGHCHINPCSVEEEEGRMCGSPEALLDILEFA